MESEAFAEQFRFEAAAREEDITVLKEQYAALQSRYEERVRDLTTRLSRLVKRHRGLEKRRNLEFEGFTKDMGRMCPGVSATHRHVVVRGYRTGAPCSPAPGQGR